MITLLAPSSAALAAGLAFPALLALYLLKLRRRPVRVSSTVLWEQAALDLQVNTPFRWLRPTLLFFLHALIVGLLVLALGRPALDAGLARARRVVLVIDRSASMRASDAPRTDPALARSRFDHAKAEAARILRELGSGVGGSAQAALITFAAEPRAVVGMTADLRLVAEEAAKLQPTDQPADLPAAMKLVAAMINPDGAESGAAGAGVGSGGSGGGSGGGAERPLVIILGDGAYPLTDPLNPGEADLRFIRCGPPDWSKDAPPTGRDNAGVAALAARRDDAQPSRLRVFARLVNAAPTPKSLAVTLAFSGETAERRAVTIPAATPAEPGSLGVAFDLVRPQAGIATISLPAGDLLAADDNASIVVGPALRPSVLFVTPGAKPGETSSGVTPEGLLADVLAELPLDKLRTVSPADFQAMLADGSASANIDLLVLDRADLAVLPPIPTLALGASLPSPGLTLNPPPPALAPGAPFTPAGYALAWKRTHPVLRDVAMDAVFVGRLRGFAQTDLPPDAASAVKLEDLARAAPGPILRVSEDRGVRRLSAAFEVAQSNWALEPGFAIFLSSAVEFLTGRNAESASTSFTTASRIELLAPDAAPLGASITLKGPVELAAALPAGSRRVVVGPLELAGVYTTSAAPQVLAVNLADEHESAVATRDAIDVAGGAVIAGVEAAGPAGIWPWCVAAAAALLALEWLIYGLRSRL